MPTTFVPMANQTEDAMNVIKEIANWKEAKEAHAAQLKLGIVAASGQASLMSAVTDDLSSETPMKLYVAAAQAQQAGQDSTAEGLRKLAADFGKAGVLRSEAISNAFGKLLGDSNGNPFLFTPPTK